MEQKINMVKKIYVKKNIFLKDSPKDVQQRFWANFWLFLKRKRNRCRIYRGRFR